MMRNQFFIEALTAAKNGQAAFAIEFKKPSANPDVRDFDSEMLGNFGTPLIHELIKQLPDRDLPPILAILVECNVDIESEDLVIKRRPLAMAIRHKKYIAAEFLIEKHAKLNDKINNPALCCLAEDDEPDLAFIRTLVEKHQADVNVQDTFGYTPLMYAAKKSHFNLIEYLLAKEASLLPKTEGQGMNALAKAYSEYMAVAHLVDRMDDFIIRRRKCLRLLLNATKAELCQKTVLFSGTDEACEKALEQELNAIAGNWNDILPLHNSVAFKEFLKTNISLSILKAYANDQQLAFCLGSLEKNKGSPIKTAFWNNALCDFKVSSLIFSFLHADSLLQRIKKKSSVAEEKIDGSSAFSKTAPTI